MSKLMGSKFAITTFAALLLAACSSTPEPEETPPPVDDTPVVDDTSDYDSGSDDIIEDPFDGFGPADQTGLATYAGGDRVFFGYDSAELTAEGQAALGKHAEWLDYHGGVTVMVEGHCDERGTRDYNLALGERRAVAVRDYLVALGVSPRRLGTISYGKERPAVIGQGETYWSQNRRGVVTVQ